MKPLSKKKREETLRTIRFLEIQSTDEENQERLIYIRQQINKLRDTL